MLKKLGPTLNLLLVRNPALDFASSQGTRTFLTRPCAIVGRLSIGEGGICDSQQLTEILGGKRRTERAASLLANETVDIAALAHSDSLMPVRVVMEAFTDHMPSLKRTRACSVAICFQLRHIS